jgi:hypothetical protein
MNFRLTTLACTAFLIGMAGAAAQQLSVVEESATSEEEAVLHSWTARVDQDISYCMKTYSDFIKSLVDTKVSKRSKSVLAADKTVIPELSPLRIDQRAIFTSESAGTAVAFTFSPGYDVHFGGDSYAKEFAKGETLVKSYVRFHYAAFYNDQIKATQDKIKGLQNDIESNGKKTDRNNKSIAENNSGGESEKNKSKNEKMKRDNEDYASDTEAKRKEISTLQKELADLNDSLKKTEAFK